MIEADKLVWYERFASCCCTDSVCQKSTNYI